MTHLHRRPGHSPSDLRAAPRSLMPLARRSCEPTWKEASARRIRSSTTWPRHSLKAKICARVWPVCLNMGHARFTTRSSLAGASKQLFAQNAASQACCSRIENMCPSRMSAVARAIEREETAGLMKLVVDAATDRILGASILGAEGGELVQILSTLMLADLPYTVLKGAIYIHPTLAEGFFGLMEEVKLVDEPPSVTAL